MCDPVTLASVALTALGTGMNYVAGQKVEGARNDAMAAERIRQSGLDQQAAALNTQSQDRYQGFEGKQEERARSLSDYFTGQEAAAPVAAAMPVSSSNITVQAENKARGDAKARTDQIGNALGELRSFGDLLGGTSRLQARDAGQIAQIGGFKKGSSNVLGMELDAANSAGSGWKLAGDIAGGLGKAGLGAGLSGAPSVSANFVPNAASPFAFGSGGYTGMGPFMNPGSSGGGLSNMFSLFGKS